MDTRLFRVFVPEAEVTLTGSVYLIEWLQSETESGTRFFAVNNVAFMRRRCVAPKIDKVRREISIILARTRLSLFAIAFSRRFVTVSGLRRESRKRRRRACENKFSESCDRGFSRVRRRQQRRLRQKARGYVLTRKF